MIEQWKIYYADNSTFSSLNGTPYEAPSKGVIVITQKEDNVKGWRTVIGDYYVYQSWGWEGVDYAGLFDYLTDSGCKTVKLGRTIPTNDFDRIFSRARTEAIND